jgi:hypothetical protein
MKTGEVIQERKQEKNSNFEVKKRRTNSRQEEGKKRIRRETATANFISIPVFLILPVLYFVQVQQYHKLHSLHHLKNNAFFLVHIDEHK